MKTIALLTPQVDDTPEVLEEKLEESGWAESLLAMFWASEKGFLDPIILQDVPETSVMNFTIRQIKDKLGSARVPATVSPERSGSDEATLAQMEMMAASSVNLVSILTKMQDGNEVDKSKKEAEKSILKAMGPTQRNLFMTLCTEEMDVIPEMSSFMTNLTSCKTPQKAISLLQSESRDWEGTFAPGAMHKLLSNGFLSQEANRANPGGFTIFSFYPKTVEVHGKGGGNELLREYLGMDVDEATLSFYAKQGYFTPKTPYDLRVTLQTALDMLELLTCKRSVATPGLYYVLQPARWNRMSTIYNDRFKTEKDFGTKFCYTMDRALQIFFDRATRWSSMASDGEPDYLRRKAENLIERIEDGRALSIMLPAILLSSSPATPNPASKKRESDSTKPNSKDDPAKKPKKIVKAESLVQNSEAIPAWAIPPGHSYVTMFGPKMPSINGWPFFNDNRLTRLGKSRRAPMCIRFQSTGECTAGCTLAHIKSADMADSDRNAVTKRFLAVYA